MKIPVIKNLQTANEQVAWENRSLFKQNGIIGINLMGAPGAGKTSFILSTIERLSKNIRPAVIEGDSATAIDAELIASYNIPVVQVNTGDRCNLDAAMVSSTLSYLPIMNMDLLFIENVGSLIFPAGYDLGSSLNMVITSIPEGEDKPLKFPKIFADADLIVLNKTDVAESFNFDKSRFLQGVRSVNGTAPVFPLSCKTGEGVEEWLEWLYGRF